MRTGPPGECHARRTASGAPVATLPARGRPRADARSLPSERRRPQRPRPRSLVGAGMRAVRNRNIRQIPHFTPIPVLKGAILVEATASESERFIFCLLCYSFIHVFTITFVSSGAALLRWGPSAVGRAVRAIPRASKQFYWNRLGVVGVSVQGMPKVTLRPRMSGGCCRCGEDGWTEGM